MARDPLVVGAGEPKGDGPGCGPPDRGRIKERHRQNFDYAPGEEDLGRSSQTLRLDRSFPYRQVSLAGKFENHLAGDPRQTTRLERRSMKCISEDREDIARGGLADPAPGFDVDRLIGIVFRGGDAPLYRGGIAGRFVAGDYALSAVAKG